MSRVERLCVGLLAPAVVAGCSGAPDVPFDARATEIVWCADADGVINTVTRPGHDGPLTDLDVRVVELGDGDVSEEDLIDACSRRFDWLTDATLCATYVPAEDLELYATSEFVAERHGEPGPDRPGFPVVVRDQVRCEDVRLQTGPAAAVAEANDLPVVDRLRVWQDVQRFNGWRQREAMWREAADGGCLDIDAAREHARTAQAELAADWPVFETARDPEDPSHAGLCLDVRLHRDGFIEVSYHSVETPGGRSGPVDDPVDTPEPDTAAGR